MDKRPKTTFQLQGVATYATENISILCIGEDAVDIANMLSEQYSLRGIAYLHYTEDLSLPADIVYIPFPAIFTQEDPMLSPVMGKVDEETLNRILSALDREVVLIGKLTDPMVQAVLDLPVSQYFQKIIRQPFRFETMTKIRKEAEKNYLNALQNKDNAILLSSSGLIEEYGLTALVLSSALRFVYQQICGMVVNLKQTVPLLPEKGSLWYYLHARAFFVLNSKQITTQVKNFIHEIDAIVQQLEKSETTPAPVGIERLGTTGYFRIASVYAQTFICLLMLFQKLFPQTGNRTNTLLFESEENTSDNYGYLSLEYLLAQNPVLMHFKHHAPMLICLDKYIDCLLVDSVKKEKMAIGFEKLLRDVRVVAG